jgi:Tfp pilus assembly protein PilN
MIKVNLLDSVTDRAKGVAAVEDKVASPRAQTILMAVVVFALLICGLGYDYVSARAEHAAAETELAKQKQIQAQMQAVNAEQAELERKTAEVQNRINVIQKLRASQTGPGELLREVKERVDTIPGLYLESLEQKGTELVLKGGSPNESSVAKLGQSLEFSSGRFGNLSIETERKPVELVAAAGSAPSAKNATVAAIDSKVKPEIVNFTIKCSFTPNPIQPAVAPAATTPAQPANQIAQK